MDKQTTSEPAARPIVLLDTNTIQHALNKDVGPQIQAFLGELIEESNAQLGISEIVIFESLKAIVFDPKKVEPLTKFIDDDLVRYPIDSNVLVGAAQLHELYGSNDATKSHKNAISNEDMIIAVTAIVTQAYIVTSDCNDYPQPFFNVIYKQAFYFESKGKRQHVIKYILQADLDMLTAEMSSREPAASSAQRANEIIKKAVSRPKKK